MMFINQLTPALTVKKDTDLGKSNTCLTIFTLVIKFLSDCLTLSHNFAVFTTRIIDDVNTVST